MIVDGPIPERVLTLAAAATIFCVMLTLGLGILLREVRRVGRNPGLVARALFAVLVAVPTLALLVVRSLALPRAATLSRPSPASRCVRLRNSAKPLQRSAAPPADPPAIGVKRFSPTLGQLRSAA